jgi:hypothetical protein
VLDEDLDVVGVDARLLDGRPHEELGVARHVLIERHAGGHQQRELGSPAAARAPEALPQRRDGARVARADHGIERADVDAELERVGGHHAADVAGAQALLDAAPRLGQVATAVAWMSVGSMRTLGDQRRAGT